MRPRLVRILGKAFSVKYGGFPDRGCCEATKQAISIQEGMPDDALMRHFIERGTRDSDGIRHSAKVAWRALALLQKEIEGEQ